MLLEFHTKGHDYLFVFDYHDDLVILNSEERPTSYHFYQIKTKEDGKHWKLADIIRGNATTDRKMPGSILGKMYLNKITFKDASNTFNFISNAHYDIKLRGTTKSNELMEVCLNKLDIAERGKIEDKLRSEFTSVSFKLPDFQLII